MEFIGFIGCIACTGGKGSGFRALCVGLKGLVQGS